MSRLSEEEKAKKHNCDGRCYWGTGMCPKVEYCEETHRGEAMATLIAILTIIGIPILIFLALIVYIIGWVIL